MTWSSTGCDIMGVAMRMGTGGMIICSITAALTAKLKICVGRVAVGMGVGQEMLEQNLV